MELNQDPADYKLADYKADIEAAHGRYTAVIQKHCEYSGVVLPLDDQGIYRAKAEARASKNQVLSAAGKRLRAGIVLRMLDRLREEVDLTPALAVKITERLLGRAINRRLLMQRYGTADRTAANKSADLQRVASIIESQTFKDAERELETKLAEAELIRESIKQDKYRAGDAFQMLSRSAKANGRVTP